MTERTALQQEIERLAFHDPLTGLANRRLFLDRLEHALALRTRSGRGCAVLFMDLDDFKKVNDTLGHSAGDQLLQEVARRLQATVRGSDTVSRFGGDEFALLLEDVDLATATRLAERIGTALRQPVHLQGSEVSIRYSIGIALAEGSTAADDILRDADAAMYAVMGCVSMAEEHGNAFARLPLGCSDRAGDALGVALRSRWSMPSASDAEQPGRTATTRGVEPHAKKAGPRCPQVMSSSRTRAAGTSRSCCAIGRGRSRLGISIGVGGCVVLPTISGVVMLD